MSNVDRVSGAPSGATLAPAVQLVRANLYRYLSVAVLPPDDPRFELLYDARFRRLVRAAAAWLRADPRFRPQRLGPGELDPGELDTRALLPATRAVADSPRTETVADSSTDRTLADPPASKSVAEAYVQVFGLNVSKDCPPYEVEYYPNTDISFRSQRLADVAGFYKAFGLERAATARDRLDHLSFEAEFMQVVIARHLYAVEEGLGDEPIEVCRRAQRRFFVDHLGWWLPAFGTRLGTKAPIPFYRGLGLVARVLTASERAVLDLPPFTELPDVNLDSYSPEGSCFGCGLDGMTQVRPVRGLGGGVPPARSLAVGEPTPRAGDAREEPGEGRSGEAGGK